MMFDLFDHVDGNVGVFLESMFIFRRRMGSL